MSAPQQQWLLKVLGGPHQGAEIGLHAGKTLVGSDDECDVVLHDVLVAPQHVELELSATGMVAAPLGGRVFIQGKRVRDARQSLTNFTFLSIGGSHLVLGPATGKWPLLSGADIPDLEKEIEATEVDKETTVAPRAEEAAPHEAEKATATPMAGSGRQEATVAKRPASNAGPILGIVAGVLLLIGWAVVYNDFFFTRNSGGGGGSAKAKVEDVPLARARTVVEELGLVGSVKIEDSAGRLSASGYVDSESRQRELQAALRATVPGLRTKIYSLEKIASSARALIDTQRLPLTVTSLSEGKLRISGRLVSADPWTRMKQTLLIEVPGLSDIEDSVEIEPPSPNQIHVYSSAPPAGSPEPPVPVPSYVVPSGLAPGPATAAPAPATPVASSDYFVSPDTIDKPEASVAAIHADEAGMGYIRLSTGGLYFAGARLPYGGTVDKIEAGSVTLIEKGEYRVLRQGDIAMKQKTSATATAAP